MSLMRVSSSLILRECFYSGARARPASAAIRMHSGESGDNNNRDRPKRPVSERGQESHGAMRSYFNEQSSAGGSGGSSPWGEMIGTVKASSPEAKSIAGPDYSGNSGTRSFNRRPAGKKGRAGVPGAPGGGAVGRFEESGGMAKVFGRKADGFDEEGEGRDDDRNIPPEIIPYLYDTPFFEEKLEKGMTMDYGDMDPIDKFFADAFMKSFDHKDHEVSYHLAKEGLNRIRLPKPRATRDLVASLVPDISSVDRVADPEAHQLGEDAWLALSKNVYFSEEEKSYISNKIAKGAKYVYDGAVELEKTGEADEFRIFSPDFHKGYDGLSVEQRREIFGHDDVEDRDMEEIKSYIDGEDLTDYDVEAVVDEDQLFG